MDTGSRERQLLALTAEKHLNVEADAAHESLQGSLFAALHARAGGAGAQLPTEVRHHADEAMQRLESALALSADLALPKTVSGRADDLRADDAALGEQLRVLVDAALDRPEVARWRTRRLPLQSALY